MQQRSIRNVEMGLIQLFMDSASFGVPQEHCHRLRHRSAYVVTLLFSGAQKEYILISNPAVWVLELAKMLPRLNGPQTAHAFGKAAAIISSTLRISSPLMPRTRAECSMQPPSIPCDPLASLKKEWLNSLTFRRRVSSPIPK